ncbi:MAG TPA: polysaccharide deacetylase family protein [Holophagaceae bacterium]|nr:polysaccharide deacetylase family protein [Holophagaceae bacterium]
MKRLLPLALLGLLACQPKPSGPSPAVVEAPKLRPWSWNTLGSVLVIKGEVAEPTDLYLQGSSVGTSMHAELGPVYWEMVRPPKGERARLVDGHGRVLAEWTFIGDSSEAAEKALAKPSSRKPPRGAAPRRPVPPHPPATPRSPAPRPKPVAPAPKTATRKAAPRMNPAAPLPAPPAPAVAGTWPGAGEGLNLTQGPHSQKVLLLSFDGGSSAEAAPAILAALKARGIHTTFFLTGAFIHRFPDIVRRILADGHEVGNHTEDHPHFAPGMRRDPAWTKARVQRELLDADEAFFQLTGRPMDPFWRAPYGEHTPEIRRWAEELGYRHVGWSEGADSLDWATARERHLYRSGTSILERLHHRLDRNGEGLVVLMHLGSERPEGDRPAEKLGDFLDRALAEGWRFVSAGDMLRLMGKPAWDRGGRAALLKQDPSSAGTR